VGQRTGPEQDLGGSLLNEERLGDPGYDTRGKKKAAFGTYRRDLV